MAHLDLALEIDAGHADTWARRARLHAGAGRHTDALEAIGLLNPLPSYPPIAYTSPFSMLHSDTSQHLGCPGTVVVSNESTFRPTF